MVEGLAVGGKAEEPRQSHGRACGATAEPGKAACARAVCADALVVTRPRQGMGRTVCVAVVPPVAGQRGPWMQSHLSVGVLFPG